MAARISRRCLPILLGCLFLGCGGARDYPEAAEPSAVKIGYLINLANGRHAYLQEQAAHLAAAEINAAGGVNGNRIQVVVNTDRAGSVSEMEGTQTLLDQGCLAILGGPTSLLHTSMANITSPVGIPLVSASATSAALSGLSVGGNKISGDLSWRTIPSDTFQGRLLAQKLNSMDIATLGILYRDDIYGRGLRDTIQSLFSGTVLSSVAYDPTKTASFSAEVQALFAAGVPQGVLLLSLTSDGAAITWEIQAYDPVPKPIFFGPDGLSAAFLENASPSIVEGMYGTTPIAPDTSEYQRFRSAFVAGTGVEPVVKSAFTYDAVYLMALAMAAAGDNTPTAIRTHLRAVSGGLHNGGTPVTGGEFAKAGLILKAGGTLDYQGVSGNIDFDINGDPTQAYYTWSQVRNSEWQVLEISQVQ